MNGSGTEGAVHVNGSSKEGVASNEVEDPEILAAIAASKQEFEEEADPAVLAAIEASKKEVEEEKKSKGPILMFSTLGKNDQPHEEEDCEENETDEQKQVTKDNVDPGDLDPEDVQAEDPSNGQKSPEENKTSAAEETSESVAEVVSAPKGRAKKEDHLTPTLRRAYITKVKPEKRYCSSDDDSDGDWTGGGQRKRKKRAPPKKAPAAKKAPVPQTGPTQLFKCPNCPQTFETIGQLNVHKHAEHGEDKPSVLDMGEAVVARLQDKAGSPKDRILKEILSDFGDVVEDKAKVGNLLGIALVEGIEYGRLRQGTSGKKNWNNYWLQENTKKRKQVMDKWLASPASVGDSSTSGGSITGNIVENSGEFMAIKV